MITYTIAGSSGSADFSIDGDDFADAVTRYVSTLWGRNGDIEGIEVFIDPEGGNKFYPLKAVARVPMGNHTNQVVITGKDSGRRPGRPAIGEPVNVRLGDAQPIVDAYAQQHGISRAEAIRRLVLAAGVEDSSDKEARS